MAGSQRGRGRLFDPARRGHRPSPQGARRRGPARGGSGSRSKWPRRRPAPLHQKLVIGSWGASTSRGDRRRARQGQGPHVEEAHLRGHGPEVRVVRLRFGGTVDEVIRFSCDRRGRGPLRAHQDGRQRHLVEGRVLIPHGRPARPQGLAVAAQRFEGSAPAPLGRRKRRSDLEDTRVFLRGPLRVAGVERGQWPVGRSGRRRARGLGGPLRSDAPPPCRAGVRVVAER